MEIDNAAMLQHAITVTQKAREVAQTRRDWEFMGYVGAALVTSGGNLYTGINVSVYCGIGFCAEHSAVSEMIKNGETKIRKIVAATAKGAILPPCGRCRELLFQVDAANLDTVVILQSGEQPLRNLLPHNWQDHFDKPLAR
jgi:cytidine deaminase